MGLLRGLTSTSARRILFKEIRFNRKPVRRSAPSASTARTVNKAKGPQHFDLEGPLVQGAASAYAVGKQDFTFDDETWVFGDLQLGSVVSVSGILVPGGEYYARKIVVR